MPSTYMLNIIISFSYRSTWSSDSYMTSLKIIWFWCSINLKIMKKNSKKWRTWLDKNLLLHYKGTLTNRYRGIYLLHSYYILLHKLKRNTTKWLHFLRKSGGFSRGASVYHGVTRLANINLTVNDMHKLSFLILVSIIFLHFLGSSIHIEKKPNVCCTCYRKDNMAYITFYEDTDYFLQLGIWKGIIWLFNNFRNIDWWSYNHKHWECFVCVMGYN